MEYYVWFDSLSDDARAHIPEVHVLPPPTCLGLKIILFNKDVLKCQYPRLLSYKLVKYKFY